MCRLYKTLFPGLIDGGVTGSTIICCGSEMAEEDDSSFTQAMSSISIQDLKLNNLPLYRCLGVVIVSSFSEPDIVLCTLAWKVCINRKTFLTV